MSFKPRQTLQPLLRRGARNVAVALYLLCLSFAGQAAEPRSLEELEQTFALQKDPRKRARLALDMLDQRLQKIRAYVATGTMIEANNALLPAYSAALERLGSAVNDAAHAGTAKNIEVGLRKHSRELEQIHITLSSEERPLIAEVMKQVVELRQAVLYSIMHPSPRK